MIQYNKTKYHSIQVNTIQIIIHYLIPIHNIYIYIYLTIYIYNYLPNIKCMYIYLYIYIHVLLLRTHVFGLFMADQDPTSHKLSHMEKFPQFTIFPLHPRITLRGLVLPFQRLLCFSVDLTSPQRTKRRNGEN